MYVYINPVLAEQVGGGKKVLGRDSASVDTSGADCRYRESKHLYRPGPRSSKRLRFPEVDLVFSVNEDRQSPSRAHSGQACLSGKLLFRSVR